MDIDCKHTYTPNVKLLLTFTNMETVRKFEVIPDKFNAVRICNNENYAQEWIN